MPAQPTYDIYRNLQRAEWDSLMFFYGIIMCVGGLGTFGYFAIGSELLYGGLGPTTANILVGVASAIVDNIPVMFAVLADVSGNEPRPVVTCHIDRGRWRFVVIDWFRCRSRRHGAGAGYLYVFCPS